MLNSKVNFKKVIIVFFIVSFFLIYALAREDSGWLKTEPGSMFTLETSYEGSSYQGVNSLTVSIVSVNVAQFILVRFFDSDYNTKISPGKIDKNNKESMQNSLENAYSAVGNFLENSYAAENFNANNLTIQNIKMDSIPAKGSSAGLAYALSLLNTTNNENINHTINVAATGSITSSGNVGSVGGVDLKVKLATDSGVDIVLVPKSEKIYGSKEALVIPVGSLEEAVNVLCTHKYYINC